MSCGCCGALPPKDVYSGTVVNNTNGAVEIKATYGAGNMAARATNAVVAPGATHFLPQETFENEGCTFTYAIKTVEVGNVKLIAPFPGVNSPTKKYTWVISGAAPAVTITGELAH